MNTHETFLQYELRLLEILCILSLWVIRYNSNYHLITFKLDILKENMPSWKDYEKLISLNTIAKKNLNFVQETPAKFFNVKVNVLSYVTPWTNTQTLKYHHNYILMEINHVISYSKQIKYHLEKRKFNCVFAAKIIFCVPSYNSNS